MAGVNKVILVGNLGEDPEVALAQQRRRSRQPARRHVGELEGPRRQPPGADRVAHGRHLQREPRPRRQELFAQGLEGLPRRPAADPQVAGPVGQRQLYDRGRAAEFRGELVLLDSRDGGGGGGGGDFADEASAAVVGGGDRDPVAPAAGGVRHRPRRRRSVLGFLVAAALELGQRGERAGFRFATARPLPSAPLRRPALRG